MLKSTPHLIQARKCLLALKETTNPQIKMELYSEFCFEMGRACELISAMPQFKDESGGMLYEAAEFMHLAKFYQSLVDGGYHKEISDKARRAIGKARQRKSGLNEFRKS